LAYDCHVHTVDSKLLDQFFCTSMDSTFNVIQKFLQVYQPLDCLHRTRFNVLVPVNVASHLNLSSNLQAHGVI